ncbi:MAG: NAD(P)/FAD-dependent oxidoreductase [Christensenellaceae bacterium]|jgi:flavin-dependent dehydrogenase|nr:NAD(P)/FAD-dependent oxidoreductase [Christensenellaceae bacterium]
MLENIVVAGAGLGGLNAAYELASHGISVTVLEQKARDTLSYDWEDDIEKGVFSEYNIPLPPKEFYKEKRFWTFVSPGNVHKTRVKQTPEHTDYSINRRIFSQVLADRATKAGAIIRYGVKVIAPVMESNAVVGVKVDNGTIYKGFVIDSLGANSILRDKLEPSFGISRASDKKGIFYAFRAFYNRTTVDPELNTNKAYLKHLGGDGISWCIDRDDSVDVLIGKVGENDKEYIDKALIDLKGDNPCLGSQLIKCGEIYSIPVRYPLTLMVANGYALIGDCAYMTIPMLGSGMASSLKAGKILADVISQASNDAVDKLWKYQVAVFRTFGAQHLAIDYMKRWILGQDSAILNDIIGSNLISDADFAVVSRGGMLKLTLIQKAKKALKGHFSLLFKLNDMLMKMNKIYKIGLSIPDKFVTSKIVEWDAKIMKIINDV